MSIAKKNNRNQKKEQIIKYIQQNGFIRSEEIQYRYDVSKGYACTLMKEIEKEGEEYIIESVVHYQNRVVKDKKHIQKKWCNILRKEFLNEEELERLDFMSKEVLYRSDLFLKKPIHNNPLNWN